MLRNVARDWLEFLQNLDYLQWITVDQIVGPVAQMFRYETGLTQEQGFLHCYSVHMDYYPMIKGMSEYVYLSFFFSLSMKDA